MVISSRRQSQSALMHAGLRAQVRLTEGRNPEHHAAMVKWAMAIVMTRRLARYHRTGRLQCVIVPIA
ncbi:hypothetical protein AB0B31_25610 [Catellatospora citrea]|uniref:hypothetical protein n=1 Tax=Catellatospora citrea TaxID=53366 RepID=UPI0033FC0074